jgi:hypothetical protein
MPDPKGGGIATGEDDMRKGKPRGGGGDGGVQPQATPTRNGTDAGAGSPPPSWQDLIAYQRDAWQRSVLFLDALRRRGDAFLEHERLGQPSVLGFASETVLDARGFERPANYALLHILGDAPPGDNKPPVLVLDPRAGHGPGIGGFRRDSEVGVALEAGHPVYFATFFPEPCEGQTLADVHHALRHFVAAVAARHPGRPPVLYGNCQAGWAAALLSADCEGIVGPAVLNGSPLSYWSGAPGINPMRLLAGLLGGAWTAEFLADLGGGRIDGAWLAGNFEALKPERTVWEKLARLHAAPEAERERFLRFERWWGGFHALSGAEVTTIVENLFVGNQLEQGRFRICEGCIADLRRIRNPLVVFASEGDDITPPHQALGWLRAVHASTEDLVAAGQRVVYLINPHVGHLGLFVSAAVARREHRAILASLEAIEALLPGLHEMRIEDSGTVRFEPRRLEDLRFDPAPKAFDRVRMLSEAGVGAYRSLLRPWVQLASNPWTEAAARWLHPMRMERYLLSRQFQPWMDGFATLAALIEANRHPADPENPFLRAEAAAMSAIGDAIGKLRQGRDASAEAAFGMLYGWPSWPEPREAAGAAGPPRAG